MNAIEIRKLRKTYGGITAVADLNLEIRQGELFSLLGVNGAGKTTTGTGHYRVWIVIYDLVFGNACGEGQRKFAVTAVVYHTADTS